MIRNLIHVAEIGVLGAALIGCTGAPEERGELVIRPRTVASSSQAIQGGTLDKTDTPVVGILIIDQPGRGDLLGLAHRAQPGADRAPLRRRTRRRWLHATSFGATYSVSSFSVTTSYNSAATYFQNGGQPHGGQLDLVRREAGLRAGQQHLRPGHEHARADRPPMTGVCPIIPRVDRR